MTIIEAINSVDLHNPNSYTQENKIEWLSMLDGIIKTEIIDTHVGADKIEFDGYNADTPMDTVLLVPNPYDEIYTFFLESKIHWENEEYGKYNNAVALYNNALTSFQAYYNKTHMPLSRGKRFLF